MKKKLSLFSIAIIFLIVASFGIFLLTQTKNPLVNSFTETASSVTPTPIPFEEMTIPYLRTKKFNGRLGKAEFYANNGTYTSYLTSYTSEGLKINALLTKPTGKMPENGWPAVVFIHGYIPPTLYVTTEKYVDYVNYLARNGFVVLKIDLRGHGDSEGEPGGGYYGSDYVIDALNAYASLQNSGFVNPSAVGMWGHSMAGNIVMRSIAVKPSIPAVSILAGAVYTYEDQRKYGINDQSYRPPVTSNQQQSRRRELFEKVGSPSADSPFWQRVAPTNYLNDLKGAVQLNHALDDEVVDIGYSRDLNSLLDNTSVSHELNEYATGGHNMEGISFTRAMQNTVTFFEKYLK